MVGTTGCCTVCRKTRALICSGCRSAEYCSKSCQKTDYRTHKLLCAEYGRMLNAPRPTANAKLAFSFGQGARGEACAPKIIWVELEGEGEERIVKKVSRDENGVIVHSKLLVQALDETLIPNPKPGNMPLNHYKCAQKFKLDHDVVLHHRHAHFFDESLANLSLFKFTDGNLSTLWGGPVTFYSCIGVKLDRLEDRVPDLDVTMSDLHVALRFLQDYPGPNIGPEALSKGGLILYELYEPKHFEQLMARYAGDAEPVRGVRISCLGDVKHLHKDEYQAIDVLPNHPILHPDQPDPYAAVLEQLGLPLIARKLFPDHSLRSANGLQAVVSYNVMENEPAIALGLILDVKGLRCSFPDFGCPWKLGPILLVREDKKELTIHQIQALVAFCKHKINWDNIMFMDFLILGVGRSHHFSLFETKQNEVREKLEHDETLKTQFQEFFENFKREKISGDEEAAVYGDASWADEVSPYDM